ncbi:sulfatase-like hydrolase/transferase [Halobellus inordinatus]|uniref:sulfatase-like hydrolase/transferase n=1 Tax=Halobellus inordinatus TaxID=1126236 RepID=UPI002113D5F2|nr:sulfatase-like hydrolase/transferase [Halobellus ramosii]
MLIPEITSLDVENVYIYVADAVRWDSTPAELRTEGLCLKTVAASVHSPASFASMVTGKYLPTHGVTDFGSRLPENLRTLFDCDGYHAEFVNTLGLGDGNDPIYSVLNQSPTDRTEPLEGVTEPFLLMERAHGGHAPYGSNSGTAAEYFKSNRNTPVETLRGSYVEGVRQDVTQFRRRLKSLENRGLRSDTLIIYTSDHGELLGEGGMFGHNGPIRPELVYVPTIFIHPDIPENSQEYLFGHTDLFPTVAAVLDNCDGCVPEHDDKRTDRRYSFYETEFKLPGVGGQSMKYQSVWNTNGGTVVTDTPRWIRTVGALDDLFDSQQRYLARRWEHIFDLLRSYQTRTESYGSPDFDFNVKEDIRSFYTTRNTNADESVELSDAARERLHNLGYS